MEEKAALYVPWWKTTANIIWGSVALLGGILGLSPLWSPAAEEWYAEHGVLGWVLAGALVLTGSIAFALLRERYLRQIAALEPKIKTHLETAANHRVEECTSDVALVQEHLGPFMSAGDLRRKLEFLPSSKDFSRELARGFDQLGRVSLCA